MKLSRYTFPLNSFYLPELTKNGIPIIKSCSNIPEKIFPYKLRSRRVTLQEKTGIHFFVDDYKFECLWKYPTRSIDYLKRFYCVFAPDFSLYLDMPYPMKLWNIYRNRWISSFWSLHGINVIPCVSWAEKDFFELCFDGLPKKSILAISSMMIKKNSESEKLFFDGLKAMIRSANPQKILVYGTKLKKEIEKEFNQEFIFYPHYRSYGR